MNLIDNLFVSDYETIFICLERHFPRLREDEEEWAWKFILELDAIIRIQVMAAHIKDFKETIALTNTLAKEIKRNQSKQKSTEDGVNEGMVKKARSGIPN